MCKEQIVCGVLDFFKHLRCHQCQLGMDDYEMFHWGWKDTNAYIQQKCIWDTVSVFNKKCF